MTEPVQLLKHKTSAIENKVKNTIQSSYPKVYSLDCNVSTILNTDEKPRYDDGEGTLIFTDFGNNVFHIYAEIRAGTDLPYESSILIFPKGLTITQSGQHFQHCNAIINHHMNDKDVNTSIGTTVGLGMMNIPIGITTCDTLTQTLNLQYLNYMILDTTITFPPDISVSYTYSPEVSN